uniref:Secreted protein n=1 Tax=Wuchereria bancrofti TaxID=6293 RepID=A0A1I8EIP6_WUCBA
MRLVQAVQCISVLRWCSYGCMLGSVVQGRAMGYQSSSAPSCTSVRGSTPSNTSAAPGAATMAMIQC